MNPHRLASRGHISQRLLYVLAGLIAAVGMGAAAVIYFTGAVSRAHGFDQHGER